MSFYFSKSKFVSAYTRCNKYAWLDKYKSEEKTKPDEFAEYLFKNGHKVGDLAKEYFNIDAEATVLKENGSPDSATMIEETKKLLNEGAKVIAEASFSFHGYFCSVDFLDKNDDGSYNIYEVKSSKIAPKKKTGYYKGVKEKYVIDAAYQQYVLENFGYKIDKVYVVLLAENYVRGKELNLKEYFVSCEVTERTILLQGEVKSKLAEIGVTLSAGNEPVTNFTENCHGCEYFAYCAKSKGVPTPSPFDLYDIDFKDKCDLHNNGISFFDVEAIEKRLELNKARKRLGKAAKKHIEYYNCPNDTYIDKAQIKKFLDALRFPLYSLDFETYQATVPEHEGMSTGEVVPFQYSLHIMKIPDGDYREGSLDLEERHFIDISGGDPRRAIAESLVRDIPFGACVIACNEKTERNIIKRLAELFPDLEKHLLSFQYKDDKGKDVYKDIQPLFKNGYYYSPKMGNSFSLKSILPALYPDDSKMNYHNLEGSVKNGTQAMAAMPNIKEMTSEQVEQLRKDLIEYCALDTLAVVKIIKKLYEIL